MCFGARVSEHGTIGDSKDDRAWIDVRELLKPWELNLGPFDGASRAACGNLTDQESNTDRSFWRPLDHGLIFPEIELHCPREICSWRRGKLKYVPPNRHLITDGKRTRFRASHQAKCPRWTNSPAALLGR